jgi:DNA-directed RNA polymerase specialized sigma subunit
VDEDAGLHPDDDLRLDALMAWDVLSRLVPCERDLLHRRLVLGLTLVEAGTLMKVGESRACQLHCKALASARAKAVELGYR